jgi:hypothetical protein
MARARSAPIKGSPMKHAKVRLALASLASLALCGCLSKSQFAGTYAQDVQNRVFEFEGFDIESRAYQEVSYDFWGQKFEGFRFEYSVRSKVDSAFCLRLRIKDADSKQFKSVWHEVEQRVEPGAEVFVASALLEPWVKEPGVSFSHEILDCK